MRDAHNEFDLDDLVGHIMDGDRIAIATGFNGHFSGVAMNATRALIRRGIRRLRVLCVPSSSIQVDMLIGAGCVASVEMGGIVLYEYGSAPRFTEAQAQGTIAVREATCPAITAGLKASESGLPFMPVRGVLGSDVYRVRQDEWKQIANPFDPAEQVAVIPAICPDIALFHAPLADRHGNVWIGSRGSLKLMARAARRTLVTYDERYEGNLMEDPIRRAGVIGDAYITGICRQPNGSWPLHGGERYPEDGEHMQRYADMARTRQGFDDYLKAFVLEGGMPA
ncbi:CoA-transferase [Pigmentiphaga sp.]|uniref:CoA transferase subunit A n=1 Tax=Pigmentiphaga sp. TaxID=1977564 RepID=UPI0025E44BBE|nr:CoA-transferase [Pigmentiphaga sp.]